MEINDACINYGNPLTVRITESSMTIKHIDGVTMRLGPDEFRDLIQLAKLLGWEL